MHFLTLGLTLLVAVQVPRPILQPEQRQARIDALKKALNHMRLRGVRRDDSTYQQLTRALRDLTVWHQGQPEAIQAPRLYTQQKERRTRANELQKALDHMRLRGTPSSDSTYRQLERALRDLNAKQPGR